MRTRRSQFSSDPMPPEGHRSVLLQEAIDALALRPDDIVVDATLGGAGHARSIASALGEQGTLIGFDLDSDAIARAHDALAGALPRVELIEANFRDMRRELQQRGIRHITKALFDLGWSSYQLDSGRGFSFLRDEPLAMTYGKSAQLTAATVVNEWSETSLADIIYGFGEERYARRIAAAIAAARTRKRIETSRQLADIIREAVPGAYRRGRLHPATKTFQALRIAVNDELGAAQEGVRAAAMMLSPGGRVAVITFHSIEDRLIKRLFAELEMEEVGARVTKKPIAPKDEEILGNPRARSAKLRIFERSHDETHTHQQVPPLDIPGEV